MEQQTQHDPDLLPLTDVDSLDDWKGVAATATLQHSPPAAPVGANTVRPASRRELEHAGA